MGGNILHPTNQQTEESRNTQPLEKLPDFLNAALVQYYFVVDIF